MAPDNGYMNQREAKQDISYYLMDYYNCGVHINTMTGSRQQKPRISLTKSPDLVDHYR